MRVMNFEPPKCWESASGTHLYAIFASIYPETCWKTSKSKLRASGSGVSRLRFLLNSRLCIRLFTIYTILYQMNPINTTS